MSDVKADSVPGLGFKDKEKAEETINNLKGRDPDYQRLAIKGLVGRAKRVLTLTKAEDKLKNLNDAMKIFEDWLKDYEKQNKGKENRAYLPLATIQTLLPLKKKYGLEDSKIDSFIKAYEKVKGEYKNLRTASSGDDKPTWDIVRNSQLKDIVKEVDDNNSDLWDDDDLPTQEHLRMILWGYSPVAARIKKTLSDMKSKLGDDANGKEKAQKRKSEGSSDDDDEDDSGSSSDESPKKKSKK